MAVTEESTFFKMNRIPCRMVALENIIRMVSTSIEMFNDDKEFTGQWAIKHQMPDIDISLLINCLHLPFLIDNSNIEFIIFNFKLKVNDITFVEYLTNGWQR